MDPQLEAQINEIDKSAKEDTVYSRELRIKFFFHWAILSGAAITLFVPFLSSEVVKNHIDTCSKLFVHLAFLSLVVSLISSSLMTFLFAEAILKLGNSKFKITARLKAGPLKNGEVLKTDGENKITKIIGRIAIISFILGVIFAYIFITIIIF